LGLSSCVVVQATLCCGDDTAIHCSLQGVPSKVHPDFLIFVVQSKQLVTPRGIAGVQVHQGSKSEVLACSFHLDTFRSSLLQCANAPTNHEAPIAVQAQCCGGGLLYGLILFAESCR
jgi:hypothetical protein